MKHLSSRAANADNNRILMAGTFNEIEFSPTNSHQSALGLKGMLIHTGGNANDVKTILYAAIPGTVLAW